jgi:hypothetical protein
MAKNRRGNKMTETIDRTRNGEGRSDEDRDEQRQRTAESAGTAVADRVFELGSYDYYKAVHGQMDSTPEDEVAL